MKRFWFNRLFELDSGAQPPGIEIAYHTIVNLKGDASNVIWICHALTANSNDEEWW